MNGRVWEPNHECHSQEGPRDHTRISLEEETGSQSPTLWQKLPVTSAELSQSSGSGVPHQPSSFSANPLPPALVLLEAPGNRAWAPFLDSRALSWEPGLLPRRDSHRAPSSACQSYSVIRALCSGVDTEPTAMVGRDG